MVGLVVGLIRFGLEFGFTKPACGSTDPQPPDWWKTWVDDIHYLHFGKIWFYQKSLLPFELIIKRYYTVMLNYDKYKMKAQNLCFLQKQSYLIFTYFLL